jgi:hypothetical protein
MTSYTLRWWRQNRRWMYNRLHKHTWPHCWRQWWATVALWLCWLQLAEDHTCRLLHVTLHTIVGVQTNAQFYCKQRFYSGTHEWWRSTFNLDVRLQSEMTSLHVPASVQRLVCVTWPSANRLSPTHVYTMTPSKASDSAPSSVTDVAEALLVALPMAGGGTQKIAAKWSELNDFEMLHRQWLTLTCAVN